MKNTKNWISAAMLVTFLLIANGGCSISPKKNVYNTLASVGLTVDKACDALVTARLEGQVKDVDWENAKVIQKKWLLAYNEACDLAAFDYSKAASEDLIKLELEVLNTINLILQGTK